MQRKSIPAEYTETLTIIQSGVDTNLPLCANRATPDTNRRASRAYLSTAVSTRCIYRQVPVCFSRCSLSLSLEDSRGAPLYGYYEVLVLSGGFANSSREAAPGQIAYTYATLADILTSPAATVPLAPFCIPLPHKPYPSPK